MTASTPSGYSSRTAAAMASPRGTTWCAPNDWHQRLVLRLRVADHRQARGACRAGSRTARRCPADPVTARVAPGGQGEHVQRGAHGQPVHRQRRRVGERPAVGHLRELVLGDHPVLGLRAAAGHHRGDRGHHPVARVPGRHVGAGFLDDARQVHAGDVRRLDAGRQRPPALPEPQVGGVHRGRRDLHQDLAGAGRRPGYRDDAEHRRVAELGEANRSHVGHDDPPAVGCRSPSAGRAPRRPGRQSHRSGSHSWHRESSSSMPRRCRCGRLAGGRWS